MLVCAVIPPTLVFKRLVSLALYTQICVPQVVDNLSKFLFFNLASASGEK